MRDAAVPPPFAPDAAGAPTPLAAAVPSNAAAARPDEAEQLLKMLDFELTRQRMRRQNSGDNHRALRALSVLLLLVLLGAAFYALWRLQTFHDSQPRPAAAAAPATSGRATPP